MQCWCCGLWYHSIGSSVLKKSSNYRFRVWSRGWVSGQCSAGVVVFGITALVHQFSRSLQIIGSESGLGGGLAGNAVLVLWSLVSQHWFISSQEVFKLSVPSLVSGVG